MSLQLKSARTALVAIRMAAFGSVATAFTQEHVIVLREAVKSPLKFPREEGSATKVIPVSNSSSGKLLGAAESQDVVDT
jgi:hypothetical protein